MDLQTIIQNNDERELRAFLQDPDLHQQSLQETLENKRDYNYYMKADILKIKYPKKMKSKPSQLDKITYDRLFLMRDCRSKKTFYIKSKNPAETKNFLMMQKVRTHNNQNNIYL